MNYRLKTRAIRPVATSLALAAALPFLNGGDGNNKDKSDIETAIRATTVTGMEVLGQQGDDLGTVSDIVINAETGEINSLVVSTGFLGLGGPERQVNLESLEKKKLVPYDIRTNLDPQAFESTPVFDPEEIGTSTDADGDAHAGQIAAMNLVGEELRDESGTMHGTVHDWIVDVERGTVPYLIVRQTNPFDVQMDYFAVSTDAIDGIEDNDLIASVDGRDFSDAERINDNTPLMREEDDATVYQFLYDPSTVVSQN